MTKLSRVSAAALALAAGTALAGGAKAETVYYYSDDTPTLSDPVIVQPAPRVHYYEAPRVVVREAPRYVVRSNTTYYYGYSNHDHYSMSSPGYVSTPTPYYYAPPGLSFTTPTGTYAPLYGGWNAYSNENVGGYDGYRTTTDR
jgi:hypothetical protein